MKGWKIKFTAKHDKECREFHITPVLTYARPSAETEKSIGKGHALSIEWGKYFAMMAFCKIYQKKPIAMTDTDIDKPELYAKIVRAEHEAERLRAVYDALDKYTDFNPSLEYCNMFGIVGLDLEQVTAKLTKLKLLRYGK